MRYGDGSLLCYIPDICWVGQKVHLGFLVTSYEKDGLRAATPSFDLCVYRVEALLTGSGGPDLSSQSFGA